MTQKRSVSMLVITGMTGLGRSALIEQFLRRHQELRLCASCTTGKTREKDNYYSIEPSIFAKMLRNNEFIEYVHNLRGDFCGTPLEEITSAARKGLIPLLDVSTGGLAQIMNNPPVEPSGIVSMFIMPPDAETLKEQLMNGNSESSDEIIARLEAAVCELDQSCLCSGIVINDTMASALAMMEFIYMFPFENPFVNTEAFRKDLCRIIDGMKNTSADISAKEAVYGKDD